MNIIQNYYHWLHGCWPDRKVEKQPLVNADGTSNIKGTYIVGDLAGVPLLKFSSDTGTKAVKAIVKDIQFTARTKTKSVHDLIIIGGGVSGYAAAIEAKNKNLDFKILEANQPFSTIENFPNKKPIYTYPTDMRPEGDLQFSNKVTHKESLLIALKQQILSQGISTDIAQASHVKRKGAVISVYLERHGNHHKSTPSM